MSMTTYWSPTLTSEFDSLVSEMDPTARTDFIFIVIAAAICFFDPTQAGLLNPELVAFEQNIFYNILKKLIISQSTCFSSSETGSGRKEECSQTSSTQVTQESQPFGIRTGLLSNLLTPSATATTTNPAMLGNRSLARELKEKIFSRLEVIQRCFESSILTMDPGKIIEVINQEIQSNCRQTIYNVIN